MSRSAILVSLVCAAVTVWIGWWAYNTFELVEEEYLSDPSGEARRNPYLLAERFLNAVGQDAESQAGRERLRDLPTSADTMIVSDLGQNLNDTRHANLMAWVERGGHLIVAATLFLDDTDATGNALLDDLGVGLRRPDQVPDLPTIFGGDPDAETSTEDSGQALEDILRDRFSTVDITFEEGESATVNFSNYQYLDDTKGEADAFAQGEYGPHMMQFNRGEGLVTVMSDISFMQNPSSIGVRSRYQANSLAQHDNAWFLMLIAQTGGKVWILYNTAYPTLTELIWKRSPQVLLAFAVLVLAWLWWLSQQYGPKLQAAGGERRNILEQLLSTGNFEWTTDKGQRRVQLSRQRLLQELEYRHPQIARLNQEARCAYLADKSGLAPKDVSLALYAGWHGERDFIQITYLIQQLRDNL